MCELNLWGIETLFHLYPPWFCNKCELNLWGIETCFPTLTHTIIPRVWIEPVRDWNYCLPLWSTSSHKVWIEPVRDWNNLSPHSLNKSILCVNWTCEGLKHLRTACAETPNLCELNLWGIETLAFSVGISLSWPRVNWTCEGLKLKIATISCGFISACELNLWGIETFESSWQNNLYR